MRKRIFDVVGESFQNDDGTSRQEELARCLPGEPIELVRELDNVHDGNAVAILSVRGVKVGHLGREDASTLAPLLDGGMAFRAQIHRLTGGVEDFPQYGCVVSIVPADKALPAPKDLDDEQARFRSTAGSKSGCLVVFVALAGLGAALELAKMHLV